MYVFVSVCVSVKTVIPLIQYPSFPTVFSSSSGVFCQDMIDSCAKAALSDASLCVWPSLNTSSVSDLCLSGGHTVRHSGESVR